MLSYGELVQHPQLPRFSAVPRQCKYKRELFRATAFSVEFIPDPDNLFRSPGLISFSVQTGFCGLASYYARQHMHAFDVIDYATFK